MPGALENLQEIRDRLGDLPSRVVDILQQASLPSPMPPAGAVSPLIPGAAASAVRQAVGELPQPVSPAFASFAPPTPMPFESAGYPQPPLPSQLGLAPGGISSASAPAMGLASFPVPAAGTSEPLAGPEPTAAAISDLQLSGPSSGGTEVVRLLRQLVEAGGNGATQGRQPAGRVPPPPGNVIWSSVWEAPPEGYAAQASPSMDVSNIAGTGGASSRRGYGSYSHPGRYWQPESDEGIPR